MVTVAGVLTIVFAALVVIWGIAVFVLSTYIMALFSAVLGHAQAGAGKEEVGAAMGVFAVLVYGCGAINLIAGILGIIGGLGALNRKGRALAITFAVLLPILGFFSIGGILTALVGLGVCIFNIVALAMNGKEFERAPTAPGTY
jgi:hypothetical protein